MTARLLALLRSPWLRWGFLAVAVGLAVLAVVSTWDQLVVAAGRLSVGIIVAVLAVSVAYIGCTFVAWRAVLTDLGSPLPWDAAVTVFGLSQIGKYVPGGVWNVVAAAEIGAGHRVPRRRSLAAMAVAVLVSIVSGAAVGALALAFVPAGTLAEFTWVGWVAPLLVVCLLPPVLNRLTGLVFRLMRREPLEHPLTWRGLGRSALWSVAAWALAGLQVWLLATGLGMPATGRTFALAVVGYALAWVVGFLVVLVPAGAGAREAVLLAVLAGSIAHGAVVLTVLSSRLALTVVDLGLAGIGLLLARRRGADAAPDAVRPG